MWIGTQKMFFRRAVLPLSVWFVLFIQGFSSACAQDLDVRKNPALELTSSTNASTTTQAGTAALPSSNPTLSPAELAYQQKRQALAQAIVQKMADIQRKEAAIKNEIYPAYQASLSAERAALQKDLDNLKFQQEALEAQHIVDTPITHAGT